ncbi:MAG TPA: tRNA (5-methylaminomethyl-2-thiouridine)(34)-methyltransferase MnmD [Flavisolibacter sp.]|nr:tRNA (5-methylaminomethyl-2-thiouridine)(34)-methyltransferase MnmD [Flavisolibacter sp.]
MKREIIITADGSHTVAIPDLNVTYHSRRGALQESVHVFIEAGLRYVISQSTIPSINLFEMGFGTGLNAFLTAIEAEKQQRKIQYTAVEQYPVSPEEAAGLNYPKTLQHHKLFTALHQSPWNEDVSIGSSFTLRKEKTSLFNFSTNQLFNLIYYDAFAPAAQPELWTIEVFQKLFDLLTPGGVLVTYCAKGDVSRAMVAAGFTVTKLPGPKGKREMLRVEK